MGNRPEERPLRNVVGRSSLAGVSVRLRTCAPGRNVSIVSTTTPSLGLVRSRFPLPTNNYERPETASSDTKITAPSKNDLTKLILLKFLYIIKHFFVLVASVAHIKRMVYSSMFRDF